MHPTWPLFDLVVRTPLLELRIPREAELVTLIQQTTSDIYIRTGFMPFHVDWTGNFQESMKFFWGAWASWSIDNWNLTLVPFIDGEPLGNQGMQGQNFKTVRAVSTGSYLLPQAQGKGLGTEMRAAALHLAFAGLGALEAHSQAHVDNHASNGVSRKLGYEVTHRQGSTFGDERAEAFNLILRRTVWEQNRRDDIEIIGLDGCIDMFGLGEASD